MRSANKPAQTALEKAYVSIVATLPCAVCGGLATDVHEFNQGEWFTSVHLCKPCHGGPGYPKGWHGTRERWTLRKVDQLLAIGKTVQQVFEILVHRR